MPRYKLTIAYNGQAFCGWQRQVEDMTVQQALEEAFLKFTGTYPSIVAAGRTDSGVHATGQVVHVNLEKDWRTDVVRDAVNQHLAGHLVAIMTAEKRTEGKVIEPISHRQPCQQSSQLPC